MPRGFLFCTATTLLGTQPALQVLGCCRVHTGVLHRQGVSSSIRQRTPQTAEQARRPECLPSAMNCCRSKSTSSAGSDAVAPTPCFLRASSQPTRRHHPAYEAHSVSTSNRPVSRPGAACVTQESATDERIQMQDRLVCRAV